MTYVKNLLSDPAFADWDQQHYFELNLQENQSAYDIRMRLHASSEGSTSESKDKYTVEEAVKHFKHIVMIGELGSGKTTALKRLTLSFAVQFQENVKLARRIEPLPVFVWLPHFNTITGTVPYDRILGLLQDAFQRYGTDLPRGRLEKLLQTQPFVLLLDGLNELGDQNTAQLLDSIATFVRNYPEHAVVVTSRTYNFQFGHSPWPIFELQELTYPADIEQYLHCYLSSAEDVRYLKQLLEKKSATTPDGGKSVAITHDLDGFS